MNIEALTDKRI